eukprot:c24321_g1_i1 orf=311-526(+)
MSLKPFAVVLKAFANIVMSWRDLLPSKKFLGALDLLKGPRRRLLFKRGLRLIFDSRKRLMLNTGFSYRAIG